MSKYSPIRTDDADLNRVQDRMRATANATTSRLDDLQTQIDANTKLTVVTVSGNAISAPSTDVTIANTTTGMVIQLPDATQISKKLSYKNTSASVVLTLKCVSVGGTQQTINGNSFYPVPVSTTATIISDGSNFHVL